MNVTNSNIGVIQRAELDIVKQCIEIINRHKLRYYMLGGTLLGSVRHKGFIPWDDDIDIGLPRPDYEQFLIHARHELIDPYAIEPFTPKMNCEQHYFAKVTNKQYRVRLLDTDFKSEVPVWVDIFPLDGVPNGSLSLWLWKTRGLLLAKLFTVSQIRYHFDRHQPINSSTKKTDRILRLFMKARLDLFLNGAHIWRKLDRHLKKYDYETSIQIVNLCGHWHMKEMFDKEVYGNGADYEFEDITMRGPEDYDLVLRQMYGDYMMLPPENQRNSHRAEIIT